MQAVTFLQFFNKIQFSSDAEFTLKLEQYEKASKFYLKPFNAVDVPIYFKNWTLKYDDSIYKKGIVLSNDHSNGKWITQLTINDGGEYTFHSMGNSPSESRSWQYLPKTIDEFISDCVRYGDIDLHFSDEAIKKLF